MEEQERGTYIQIGQKIKQYREDNALTLKDLSDRTGLSTAVLSQIENHLVSPPLGTLIRITRALDLRPGHFFDEHPDKPFTLVRKDERTSVSRFASTRGVGYGYSYEALGHDMKGRHMEPFLVTLEPAAAGKPKPSCHEGEEFLFVLQGEMELTLDKHSDVLRPGDAVYYDSNLPHLVRCRGEEPTLILAVIYSG